jgi:hypothetical protein
MKRWLRLAVLGAMLMIAAPALADHNRAPSDSSSSDDTSLDFDLKLGARGFRFGSRFFGRDGALGGAWLNGETRRDGFTLDGRVEHDGKTHQFRFDADLEEWLRRAIRWGVTEL